jgi:arylsulfatase A-like enzyme
VLQEIWARSGNSRLLRADELSLALLVRAYDRGIERFDAALGQLLDGLAARPDWPRTAMLVTSDHGESLYEHGWGNHGRSLFGPELRIPLAARLPGVSPQPGRVACPVSLIDLAPTVCDYLGVRCPRSFVGQSLLRDAAPAPHYLVSELAVSGHARRAIRNARLKLIERPDADAPAARLALYDLRRDPDETRNLLAPGARVAGAEAVAGILRGALAVAVLPFAAPEPTRAPLDPVLRRRLRELGYLEEAPPTTIR